MEIVCDVTKKPNCDGCTICSERIRYGSCFNCRFRDPLRPPTSGGYERCVSCYHPPQPMYVGMVFNTATGWVWDGDVEINAISNAVFEMHGTTDIEGAYKRLKAAIFMVEGLDYVILDKPRR